MPAPPNLLKAFEKGYVQTLVFANADQKVVPTGKKWLILYGQVVHTTGTASSVGIYLGGVNPEHLFGISKIGADIESGTYPFGLNTGVTAAAAVAIFGIFLPLFLLSEGDAILFAGHATGTLNLAVLEWSS